MLKSKQSTVQEDNANPQHLQKIQEILTEAGFKFEYEVSSDVETLWINGRVFGIEFRYGQLYSFRVGHRGKTFS